MAYRVHHEGGSCGIQASEARSKDRFGDDGYDFDEVLQLCDAIEMQRALEQQPEQMQLDAVAPPSTVPEPCPPHAGDEATSDSSKPEASAQMAAVDEQRFPSIECLFTQLLDLPLPLADAYKRRGVHVHYRWQEDCLMQPGVVSGRNLLYSAPTSGGKSFVAEVLLLRRVLLTRKKALFVLPFVAVVREKVKHLRGLLTCYNNSLPKRDRIRIKAFHGGKGGKGLGRSHIGVCTIEKANALVNKLIEDGRLSQLTCLIIDELHMVADKQRGYLMEIMLSKLKFIQSIEPAAAAPPPPPEGALPSEVQPPAPVDIQIIGLSATLPNLEEVAAWIDCTLYRTDFRPVRLLETYLLGTQVMDGQGVLLRTVPPLGSNETDPNGITTLTRETCSLGDQVILFCPSRRQCEACAKILARVLLLTASPTVIEERAALVRKLTNSPSSLDPILAQTMPEGVAFHHAGLTDEEKQGVEDGFRNKTLSVIVATSTLGAGVNLPAARVIFRTVKAGGRPMEIASYRQMAGRAGRAGHQTYGESIIIVKNEGEAREARRLITESLPELESCLWPGVDGGRGLVRAILEAVTAGALRDVSSLDAFVAGTLTAQQIAPTELPKLVAYGHEALDYLSENRIVELEPSLAPTKLGRAIFQSSFSPDEGLLVFHDLVQARRRLILESNLHLLYLLTPVTHNLKPDFTQLLRIYLKAQKHEPAKAEIFKLVGLEEVWLEKWSRQPPNTYVSARSLLGQEAGERKVLEGEKLGVLRAKRMWAALILAELVQEVKLEVVASRFQAAKGEVQAFQASATTFCGMVQAFLTQLDWILLARALGNMVAAVSGQPAKELQPLFQLPHMRLKLAQALFAADLRSVAAVAAEPEARLAELLRLSQPFDIDGQARDYRGGAGQEPPVSRWLLSARRLKEAANGVLEREDKHRQTRLQALQAQWGAMRGGGGMAYQDGGENDEDGGSDSEGEDQASVSGASDSEEGEDKEEEEGAGGEQSGVGDLGVADMEWAAAGEEEQHNVLVAVQDAGSEGGTHMQLLNPYDTPMSVRQAHKEFRPVDFPGSVTPLTPAPSAPSSSKHYLYKPHERRVSMSPPDADKPAQRACARAGVRVPPLATKYSCEGLRARHLSPWEVDAFLDTCRSARCFAFNLNFRGLPPRVDDRSHSHCQPDTLRFIATSSMPEVPVRNYASHGYGLLTGLSISLDGRQCYHLSLPPPFRHRPFQGPCLGDPAVNEGPCQAGETSGEDAMDIDRGAQSEGKRAVKLVRRGDVGWPSVAQSLPARALSTLFSFLGFTHGPHLEYGGGLGGSLASARNSAFVACRHWNSVGCQWFNDSVSRRTWSRVKALMEKDGLVKIVWDATTAMTALKERGIELAEPIEDPKVGMWLLGSTAKFQLVLPPPESQVDCLAFPAGAMMRLAACVENLLDSHRLMQAFRLTEMPLIPSLCELQFYGMRIARSWFPQVLLAMQERLLRLQELANAYTKCDVNIRSGDAVQNMLYAVLRLKPPPRWVPKTTVFNSSKTEPRKADIGPTSSDMLELMVDQSPAVKVVLEYRSLFHTLNQLQTFFRKASSHYILGNHRVRPKADATGSSTGRVILSDPGLQHVQHEITLQRVSRVSIQDELDLLIASIDDPQQQPPHIDSSGYMGLPVAVLRATAYWGPKLNNKAAAAAEQENMYATSQLGVLREILPKTIGESFEADGAETGLSLADYWRAKGFAYTKEEEGRIRQLCVEFQGPQPMILTYPADKVFRQCAEITNPDVAATELFSGETEVLHPRAAFRAADGFVFLSADYSQIEMRLLAHFSGDELLCKAFHSDMDVFQKLAATWKNIPEEEVTPATRSAVKQLAYAMIYGQGADALGQQLGVSRAEAQRMQSDFLRRYPGLKTFAAQTRTACKTRGFVETLLGRRRYLPNINSDDSGKQAQAERQALNTVCQGSAADLIKLAMINIHHHIHNTLQPQVDKAAGTKGPSTLRALGVKDCRLVLQVHDELVYEVRTDLVPEMKKVIRKYMEGAVKLQVPLRVNVKEGVNWGEMEAVK